MSDATAAADFVLLSRHQISHIVNLTCEFGNAFPATFTYLNVRAKDNGAQQLLPHFGDIAGFVEQATTQPQAKVLIHCSEGVSRSTTAVIAWLMYKERLQLGAAFDQVKSLRPVTEPNPSFLQQLRQYETALHLPHTTTRRLTFLDTAPMFAPADSLLGAVRCLTSKAATGGTHSVATQDLAACSQAMALVAQDLRPAALQQVVCATLEAYGGRLARDEAARLALAAFVQSLLHTTLVGAQPMAEALRTLPATDAWQALDLPLGQQFLAQLQARCCA